MVLYGKKENYLESFFHSLPFLQTELQESLSKLSKDDRENECIKFVFDLQSAAALCQHMRYFYLMNNGPKGCSSITKYFMDTRRIIALKELIAM